MVRIVLIFCAGLLSALSTSKNWEILVDIGEEAPPSTQPPGSIAELTNVIERCFQDGLSSLQILNHCNKAVLG